VAIDYQRELKLAKETTAVAKTFTLPDGHVIKVGPERFMACEALFRPSLADVEGPGIAELLFNCVQASCMCCHAFHAHIGVVAASMLDKVVECG